MWTSLIIGTLTGVMGLELVGIGITPLRNRAIAQVVLDGSLGPSGSLTGPNYTIEEAYGVIRQQNLFHSFWQFNLPNPGDSASFLSSSGIRNILARVTGNTQSYINGQISAGAVNLFLINPNGIIFGPSGSLNVGGSFIASTLDTAVWPSGAQFSARNFDNPHSSLLSFAGDPSGFLAALRTPGPVGAGYDLISGAYSPSTTTTNLSVPDGQSLLLIGGDVFLNKANLTARGGRIDLAAVRSGGTVDLSYSSQNVPILERFNPISGTNLAGTNLYSADSYLDVSATGTDAGTIQLQAGSMDLDNTTLDAGSFRGGAGSSGFAGRVDLTGWEDITVRNNSRLYADSTNNNLSNWGVVAIEALAGSVTLDSTHINAENFGTGYAGDIVISGGDRVSLLNDSRILSTGNNSRIAIGGGLTSRVQANQVTLRNSQINTRNSLDFGTAGYISISALDQLELTNTTIDNQGTDGQVTLGAGSLDVDFSPRTLTIANSTINTALTTQPNSAATAGRIQITALDQMQITDSRITSIVASGIDGTAGTITLETVSGDLQLTGVTLNTSNDSTGLAGKINLTGENVSIFNSQITSRSDNDLLEFSSIAIAATAGSTLIDNSIISTSNFGNDATPDEAGYAGDVAITARDQLLIQNNSQILSQGNFGLIYLGSSSYNDFSPNSIVIDRSTLGTANEIGVGRAGNITIDAVGTVTIRNHSSVYSDMDKAANAGNIFIQGNGGVSISDSEMTSKALSTNSTGTAGKITILAPTGAIDFNNATLSSSSEQGSGVAGTIKVSGATVAIRNSSLTSRSDNDLLEFSSIAIAATAGSTLIDNSTISTSNFGNAATPDEAGYAGDVAITARDQLLIQNNSQILSQGNFGLIYLGSSSYNDFSPNSIVIDRSTLGTANEIGVGTAGNITMDAVGMVTIRSLSSVYSDMDEAADAGNIFIQGNSGVSISDSQITSKALSDTSTGQGGNITIVAPTGAIAVNRSEINTSTDEGFGAAGSIDISGQNVALFNSNITSRSYNNLDQFGTVQITATTGSLTLNNVFLSTSNLGDGLAGDISLTARDQVALVNNTEVFSQGDSGLIFIGAGSYSSITPNSVVIDQSTVQTNSRGKDFAGDIGISATNQVAILNNSQIFSQGNFGRIFIGASQFSAVSPQTLTISNSELNTVNVDPGRAGDISLVAANQLAITNSQIFSDTGGVANAGEITVRAGGNLAIANSQLTSSVGVGATGNGGTINLYGHSIFLSNGAQVKTSTAGAGNSGNINVYAIDQFNLDGAGTGLFATTESGSTGTSGSIFVDPIAVNITNGAGMSVNSQGSGNGGNLTLYAGNLTLSNGAFLTAATASGQGGNINLLIQNLLLMRHGSLISATAGGTGNGGNINLAAKFVVAVPGENSDIIANAFQGKGGSINITTQGLFGIDFRPRLTPFSDITASSDFGLQGTVAISTPDVDVQSALSQLAGNFVNPDQLVAGSCIARRNASQGSFVVTGTGGLPTTPYDDGISSRYEVMGVRGGAIAHSPTPPSATPSTASSLPPPTTPPTVSTWKSGDPVQEASGITITPDGRKFLGSWEQARAIASPDMLICQ